MEPHTSNMSSNSYSHSSSSHGGLTSLKKVFLLHGTLKILIESAKNLPNKDRFTKKIGDKMVANLGILQRMSGNTSDPFVTVSLSHGNALVANTCVIKNCEEPIWNQHFCIPVAHNTTDIHFTVMDKDQFTPDEEIGVVLIPAELVFSGDKIEDSCPLLDVNGKECNPGAVLSLSVQYIPATLISGSIYSGVPDAYFPLKKGGTIKLYQDAHVPDGCLPDFKLDNEMNYKHGNCWRDIFDAIIQAKHIIYIAGWSVSHMISLVRDGGSDSRIILGDLLKQKAQEKVRVLLLVWDDSTSKSFHGHTLQFCF